MHCPLYLDKSNERSIQVIYQQKQEEYGNLCVPLSRKGTRNSFSCCIRRCIIDCSKGLSDEAVLLIWARQSRRQQLPAPHATACPMRAPPRSDPIPPGCYCEPADVPEIGAKTGPLAARDLCCNCPSLPRYAAGKRAITSLSEIMQIPSELSAFILGFACSVSEPSGHAQVTNLKCCSNLHQIEGWCWY